jgi:alginate O-acetyltransferase complex protein AlgI
MLFNSLEFAIFFPVVSVLFFLLPHRFRWFLLLAASCFFYMFFKPVYILILVFTIVIDYFAGIWIARQQDKRKRKLLLTLSILANVGVLAIFKYYNFIAENVNIVLNAIQSHDRIPFLSILLPIGLSFHTFQAMSYTIEVYRGHQQPEKHFGMYALYVMFYPQLVAGPIERPQNIIHQLHEEKQFNYENARAGLVLMAWGLFKKVVIADRLALFVNQVYGNLGDYTGIPLILATIAFAFQIYCDFSGYSDIALGSARFMGYNLMTNFDKPYGATRISDFWRRWHISLSSWFRDYVYIPLGGNRGTALRTNLNLFIVFLLSGIWHGANWTFVAWGALHGLYLIVENNTRRWRMVTELVPVVFRRAFIFSLVCFAWIFFRAPTISDAFYVIRNASKNIGTQLALIISNEHLARLSLLYLHQSFKDFALAFTFVFLLILIQALQREKTFDAWLLQKGRVFRYVTYYALVGLFIFFGVFNKSEFIYFQF